MATALFLADVRAVGHTNIGVDRMKSHLKLVKPDAKNRAVVPRRLANSKYRSREHLTQSEVEKLMEAAKTNRYGHRDETMLLVAYRHGLRASELCGLEWSQVDFNGATMHVRRAKNGKAPRTPSGVTKCAYCASFNAKLLGHHSYSLMSEVHRSHRMGSIGW
jgi:integrase